MLLRFFFAYVKALYMLTIQQMDGHDNGNSARARRRESEDAERVEEEYLRRLARLFIFCRTSFFALVIYVYFLWSGRSVGGVVMMVGHVKSPTAT